MKTVSSQFISQKIYFIRGHRVMLDNDLAELYEVPAKRLNEQVKRNRTRFPEDFMFQLNTKESDSPRVGGAPPGGRRPPTDPCVRVSYTALHVNCTRVSELNQCGSFLSDTTF